MNPLVTRNSCGDRAEYGKQLFQFLSDQLTAEFVTTFTVSNLSFMCQFNQTFPIRKSLHTELTWTHYRARHGTGRASESLATGIYPQV